MKIVVLCANHSLGDERVVVRQSLSLAQAGYDVTVLGREDPEKRLPVHPRLDLRSTAPLIRGASLASKLGRFKVLFGLRRQVLDLRPDLIVAHEPDSAFVALSARRRCGAPVHFDVHECFEEMAAERAPRLLRGLVRFLVWRMMAHLGRRCDWITVVSPTTARQFRALRPEGRVDILHNSPRSGLFPVCNQDVGAEVTLCHEGWLDISYGMQQLIEAVALARKKIKVRLLLVGKVRVGSEQAFDQLVKQHDLGAVIQATGWLPYDEVGRTDAQAQIGLVVMQPSGNNYGSLSNKLYSYMACGHALVVPRGSASEELVRQYHCGVGVDVTRAEEIAAAIVRLAQDVGQRKEFGANARRAIVEELSWEHMEGTLRNICSELTARPRT
ncbi:MAG: glycosyltransferase family 4 protein [Verrucomicrobiales bacterium]|nr:glycosyltransferase family 4 protein [Verrucomicrobiales bacterium]